MKNVIGNPARGESFFPRGREIDRIISHLDDGNNLNIAAPRRIGKTSILLYLLDNEEGHYVYVYIDTEAVDKESDFFKKILKEILKVDEIKHSKKLRNLFEAGHKFIGKIKGIKILGQGIDFSEDEQAINYKEDLINLLSGIELEDNRQVVIMIDEFPQTIQNIVGSTDNIAEARQFLQSNREIRMNPNISQRVKFILTGSIGLNHTVAEIDSSAFVNDLNSLEIGALNEDEAKELLGKLLSSKKIFMPPDIANYLLDKIEWLIPFHIQLAVQEISTQCRPGQEITTTSIDRSFEAIIQARNNNHFDHYYSRLKKQFKGVEFNFSVELLNRLATNGMIRKDEIFDLSVKYNLEEKWKHIIELLIYDGYINNSGEMETFKFNSPIVRMWWKRFICK